MTTDVRSYIPMIKQSKTAMKTGRIFCTMSLTDVKTRPQFLYCSVPKNESEYLNVCMYVCM